MPASGLRKWWGGEHVPPRAVVEMGHIDLSVGLPRGDLLGESWLSLLLMFFLPGELE